MDPTTKPQPGNTGTKPAAPQPIRNPSSGQAPKAGDNSGADRGPQDKGTSQTDSKH
jgi:hypothetical protein